MTSPPQIRNARLEDAGAIARILVDSRRLVNRGLVPNSYLDTLTYEFKETYYRKILVEGPTDQITLVAETEGNKLGGFINGNVNSERSVEIQELYIPSECQRQGFGLALVKHLFRRASSQGATAASVSVLTGNPNRAFYEAVGAKLQKYTDRQIGDRICPMAVYCWTEIEIKKLAAR